jgi:hypothetical protein
MNLNHVFLKVGRGTSGGGNILVPTHPIGKIPTLCQREMSRHNCPTGNIPTAKKGCRDISCWATGNIPTEFLTTGNIPTAKNIVRIFPVAQQEMSRQQKYCRDISCWTTGNIPTYFLVNEHFYPRGVVTSCKAGRRSTFCFAVTRKSLQCSAGIHLALLLLLLLLLHVCSSFTQLSRSSESIGLL